MRSDRELAFYKIRAPHGSRRSEILELASIFRAKVVDVGPSGLTIALSGDPGKLYAFEQAVRPFGLAQLARTGRITLQKSDENLDMGGHMTYTTGRSTARAARDEAASAPPPRIAPISCRLLCIAAVSIPCHPACGCSFQIQNFSSKRAQCCNQAEV